MGKYTSKMCVYLDQFAVSYFSENQKWSRLRDLLIYGVKCDKLFIPYSFEHLIESSQKDFERAKIVDDFLFSVSDGIRLETETVINARLLLFHVRKKPINKSIFTAKIEKSVFSNPMLFSDFRNLKQFYNQMVSEGTLVTNELRSAIRLNHNPDFSHLPLFVNRTSEVYKGELVKRLSKFSKYGFYDKHDIRFSMITIPFWADTLINMLINEFGMTRSEAKKAAQILKQEGIKKIIPPLYVRASLESITAIKQKKELVNDHIDIVRLCSAIPFCDLIVTDKSKMHDIQMLGLHDDFKTEIFSGSNSGLLSFEKRIEQLIN